MCKHFAAVVIDLTMNLPFAQSQLIGTAQLLPTPFTPLETLAGGLLLHIATSTLLEDTGSVLGVSGIISRCLPSFKRNSGSPGEIGQTWRHAVLAGMIAAPITTGLVAMLTHSSGAGGGGVYPGDILGSWEGLSGSLRRVGIAGFLVGMGSSLGSGCTSGHMLCGASRLSLRSITSTLVFFPTAILTSYLFPIPITNNPLADTSTLSSPTLATMNQLPNLILPITIGVLSRYYLRQELSSPRASNINRNLVYFLCGWTFGMGLLVSGMADPSKVHSFLRIWDWPIWFEKSTWDPSMIMIILSGVIPNGVHYHQLLAKFRHQGKQPSPRYSWAKWGIPSPGDVTWRLVVGAAIFGAGWGLAGVCPGPAMVGVGSLWSIRNSIWKSKAAHAVGIYVVSMLGGMMLGREI